MHFRDLRSPFCATIPRSALWQHWSFCFKPDYYRFPLIADETHGYQKKRANNLQEGKSICTLRECEWVCVSIFIRGRFVEGCFSVFSFVFYNTVKSWSRLLTYPKATGQTVWQGSVICQHCAYGHSLRSLLKGALQSFAAVARLLWGPTSTGPCVTTPGGRNTPHRCSTSTRRV